MRFTLLTPLLALLTPVLSWRLLNDAERDCSYGGTYIQGAGSSACLVIDPSQPGFLLQYGTQLPIVNLRISASCENGKTQVGHC